MTATAAPTIISGHCGIRRHGQCIGRYAGYDCRCDCHTAPPPLPLLEVGQRVLCAPGARWASEDLSGAELEVLEVHDYPAEVGGPVFICRWPGTTSSPAYSPHLQAHQLEGPRL